MDGTTLAAAPVKSTATRTVQRIAPTGARTRKPCRCAGRIALAVRYNLRSHRTEWQGIRLPDADVWEPINQRSLANIREGIARSISSKRRMGRALCCGVVTASRIR